MKIDGYTALAAIIFGAWYMYGGDSTDTTPKEAPKATVQNVSTEKEPVTAPAWGELDICTRSVMVYFFLLEVPRLVDIRGNLHVFESSAGNRYNCKVNDNRAILTWDNKEGTPMVSNSTVYTILSDGRLLVDTTEQKVTFDP